MTSFAPSGVLTAILSCNDLDASERFYSRLGFVRTHRPAPGEADSYRLLSNGSGGYLHLTDAVGGWLVGRFNFSASFLGLAAIAVGAVALLYVAVPETLNARKA